MQKEKENISFHLTLPLGENEKFENLLVSLVDYSLLTKFNYIFDKSSISFLPKKKKKKTRRFKNEGKITSIFFAWNDFRKRELRKLFTLEENSRETTMNERTLARENGHMAREVIPIQIFYIPAARGAWGTKGPDCGAKLERNV